MSDAPIPGLFTLLPLFSPTSSTSLHVQLSALSLCSFLSIYSFGHFIPPLPPPTQLLSFTCFNSLSESLSSYRLGTWSLCCQPDFKVCISPSPSPSSLLRLLSDTPQANLQIFKDQTLTARREQARQRNCVNHGGEWEAK